MRTDFIFDVETIGQNVHACPIIDIAYTAFTWDRFTSDPYSFEELVGSIQTSKLSVEDQIRNYDCSYKKDDLKFWQQQSKEAFDKIKPSKNDLTIPQMSAKLFSYLNDYKVDYWWTRSNTFDPIILWRIMDKIGEKDLLNEHLKWWRVRDIRTFIDAKFDFTLKKNGFVPVADIDYWNKTFVAHDSTHDVAADVLRLQTIIRAENDLEQIDR